MNNKELLEKLDLIHQNLVMIGKNMRMFKSSFHWSVDNYGYFIPGFVAVEYIVDCLNGKKSVERIRKDLAEHIVKYHTGYYVPANVGEGYINANKE